MLTRFYPYQIVFILFKQQQKKHYASIYLSMYIFGRILLYKKFKLIINKKNVQIAVFALN